MNVRAVKSFVWNGRDVDLGDEFDVPPREAHLLVEGYQHCVYLEAAPPPPSVMVTHGDPVIPPVVKQMRRR